MATYVNDLRLKEIATGDESGTWGTSTNTNLELIAEAFSFGTEAITTNADTHTTTIADGSTDPGRSIFLKYTGTLDSACTITIGPNTVSKLWLIENATSGSQTIIIKQGSGATITVPNGQTKAIYSDGAGSGGAMVDAFQDLSIPDLFIDDDLTFTSDSAVITFGADGDTTLTHTDGSGLTLNSTNKIMFNDASQFIQGSSATVLSLGATDEIDLTATLIDINGNADVSGTVTATGTSVFASLDISGDIDVDGTTNLDVVDIDGALTQDGGAVFNEASADVDFRVESNANTHAFFLEGSTGNVMFGGSTFDNGNFSGDANGINVFDATHPIVLIKETTSNNTFEMGLTSAAAFLATQDAIPMKFATSDTVVFEIAADGAPSTPTAGTSNVRLGVNAGDSIQSGGNFNVVVGDEAGTAINTGDQNVAIGYEALKTEDTGSRNTAVGAYTLNVLNNDALSYNTAIGYAAGLSVSTGIQNTIIGGLAGDADTQGKGTTAIGYNALTAQNFTSDLSSFNVAVGHNAGLSNTTGTENVLIGADAARSQQDVDGNVAIGYASMYNNTNGDKNVAVGRGTLVAMNYGSATDGYNVAIGYDAGNDVTTGVQNTFIGGLSGDATVDSSNNTAVGYLALSADSGGTNTAVGSNVLEVATGFDNTAMGMEAGVSVTSGHNNLLLGHDAGRSGSPGGTVSTANDHIVLGDENITSANVQVDWGIASDERDKTDFADLNIGLDFVKALEPITYYWDKRSKYGDKTAEDYDLNEQTPDGTHKEDWMDVGFKAQSVSTLEEAAGYDLASKKNLTVSVTEDGKQYSLQYSKFVPILVKAIQELSAQVTALQAEVNTLKGG